MLYERWRHIAQKHRGEVALYDTALGRDWTFAQLAAQAESHFTSQEPVVYPQGATAEFILSVLQGWWSGKVVCPLEAGQAKTVFPKLPAGCFHLKTTSATTGASRAIVFTGEQLAADAENIVATMGLHPDRPNLGVISMAHSYGFSNLVLPLLLHGIPLILAPTHLPESVRRAAALAKQITLPAVPALWRAWHDADSIPSNVSRAISAGAPLPLALEVEIFSKRGLKIHNFYGASECGGIAYDANETPRSDAECVGLPMKNVSLAVADDGCLEVRSRAVAETYWPQSDQNLGGGCFHTSDLAEISSGQVFLRGRVSDQINVAGRKISPETIERALLKHPQVLECLVFGVPSRDTERTEEIVVVIVPGGARHSVRAAVCENSEGAQRIDVPHQKEEAIFRQFALETLPAWQAPRHWWFVEALQTNARGKVSRAEWRERWLTR